MRGEAADRLGWAAALGGATILHVAIAFGATQLPPRESPSSEVAISILDLTEAVEMTGISAFSAVTAIPPVGMAAPTASTQSAARMTPNAGSAAVALTPIEPDVLLPGARSETVQAAAIRQSLAAVTAQAPVVAAVAAGESAVPSTPARRDNALGATSVVAALADEASMAARPKPQAVGAVAGNVVAPAAVAASVANEVAASSASVAPGTIASPIASGAARTAPANAAQRLTAAAPAAPRGAVARTPAVPPGPSSAMPAAGHVETVAALPEAPPTPLPTRTEIAHLIDSFDGGDCFRATASGEPGHPLVETLAGAKSASVRLAEAIIDHFGEAVPVEAAIISAEQCRALSFLDRFHRPAASRMAMAIQHKNIASGTTLTGELAQTADDVVHLLIVDDEGKIQAANAYVVADGDDSFFTVPVVVTGGGANRPQLLLAIVAPELLQTAAEARDVLADRFFSALEFELVVKQIEVDFSVASFTVE